MLDQSHVGFTRLARLLEIARVTVWPGSAVVAAGATSVFCKAQLGGAVEGAVVGFGFTWEAEDLKTSPVSLVAVGAQGSGASAGEPINPPFTVPVCKSAQDPFFFPHPYGVRFGKGFCAGLQITNNEASAFYAEGVLYVATWTEDERRALEELEARERPWQGRVFD